MQTYNPNRRVEFGSQIVGDGLPTFVTYEAGPTHDGLSSAKKLVELAAQAGANAIKFQIMDPDRLVHDRKQLFSYDILVDRETGERKTVEEPLYDLMKRRSLSSGEWKQVKDHAASLELAYIATIGFPDELDLLVELKCDSVKIASADVDHWPLIRHAAKSGLCIQLDTGNASLGEIEAAVDICLQEGNDRIIIHQCPSGYPARLPSINLRIIETLRQMFPQFPIAFSDHTPGADMDIAAITLGANLVEKTISFDRTTPSIEHLFSLEPDEMKTFIQRLRDVETALGGTRRLLAPQELAGRAKIRRSAFLLQAVEAGIALHDAEIEFRRPGTGLTPKQFEELPNAKFAEAMPAGEMIRVENLAMS